MFGKSYLKNGLKLYESHDYVPAINKLNKAIESEDLDMTETYIAYFAKGVCLSFSGNTDDAIKSLECALQCINTDYRAYNELGRAYINNQNYEESIKYLEKAIKLGSDDANSWAMKGFALFNLERYDDAETTLNFALNSIHSDDPEIIDFIKQLLPMIKLRKKYKIGTEFLNNSKYADAINIYDSILKDIGSICAPELNEKKDQIHVDSLIQKGDCMYALKKYDSAIKLYKESLDIIPNNKIPYQKIAESYLQLNMFDEALEYYEILEHNSYHEIEKIGTINMKHTAIFDRYIENKDFHTALDYANSIPEINNEIMCFKKMLMGKAHFCLDNYDETLKCLLPYVERDWIDSILSDHFKSDPVKEILGIVYSNLFLLPTYIGANTYVGGVYYKRNEYKNALKYLLKCNQDDDIELADTEIFKGECYIALGEYENAVEALQKAIDDFDQSSYYDLAYLESRLNFAKEKLYSTSDEAECPVCPKCGAKVVSEDTFCRKCGNKLNENN